MRDILNGCLLTWNQTASDRKPPESPRLKIFPYKEPTSSYEGRVIIEDTDGSVWEALYTDTTLIGKDFQLLVDEWRRSNNRV